MTPRLPPLPHAIEQGLAADTSVMLARMMPSPAEVRQRLAFLNFQEEDAALLRDVHDRLAPSLDAVIGEFYRHLRLVPELDEMLGDSARFEGLQRAQAGYFHSLTRAEIDSGYVRERVKVGLAHRRIGLEPQWYIGAYRKYLAALSDVLREVLAGQPELLWKTFGALLKLVCFDLGLALDTYIRSGQEELLRLANHDTLTGLANRALLLDRLSQAIAYARRASRWVAVLFLDLDRFKNVNDSLGHDAGDQVLVEVARRLSACVRSGDTVARLGGDEFVVLLSDVARGEEVAALAQKLADALAAPMLVFGHEITPVASFGVSLYPRDGADSQSLLKNADAAMYSAKKLGGAQFQFYALDMNLRTLDRLKLEAALRHAVERDEFELHYQPQIALGSGAIAGVEALVRWRRPGHGLVPPADFIPVAEETGLIIALGEWVLRAACAQLVAWRAAGIANLRMAVNLSARQFKQLDLAHTVVRVLHDTGCDPDGLELEITESVLMENPEAASLVMRQLSDMGVQLSIDDFGSGYSSLAYLKRFPIHTLKIDRSFVHDISTDADDAAIASAIIALAHSMKLNVIAEGVETAGQLDFLQRQRCDQVQGFYFSRPLPAAELWPQLAAGAPRGP